MFLSDEHLAFHQELKRFANEEVMPRAYDIDREQAFPEDLVKRMAGLGWMGLPYPKNLGGGGRDTLAYAMAVEEISRACGSTGITLAAHTSLGTNPIYMFGNPEQHEHWMPKLCAGQTLGAFGLTEPSAGSDAGGTRTRARLEGDEWVVDGSKMWITNAAYADVLVISAVTDADSREISCFLVERGMPGYTIGPCEKKMGLKGSDTHELSFENLRLPKSALLGQKGDGFKQMLKTLDGGRISIGAMALGLAQGALDEVQEYLRGTRVRQSSAFDLADMALKIECSRHLVYNAARLKDAGQAYSVPGAMAKLHASETASYCADRAMQLLGSNGLTSKFASERIWRDAKLCEIGEGTSEVQRLVISRSLLGAKA